MISRGALFHCFLWIDKHTDHKNILCLHGLHLRELLNWLVLLLVNHTGYKDLFFFLSSYNVRSIFGIVFFNLEKDPHKRGLFIHNSYVSILITCKSNIVIVLFNLDKNVSFQHINCIMMFSEITFICISWSLRLWQWYSTWCLLFNFCRKLFPQFSQSHVILAVLWISFLNQSFLKLNHKHCNFMLTFICIIPML